MIKFGPAGIGGINEIQFMLERYKEFGLKAAEIPFTYRIWINDLKDAKKIKELAKKNGIELSIHAPYWINLNSIDKIKIERSEQRILKCCEIGKHLGVKKVIFHCGYYGKMEKEETFQNIKQKILEMQEIIKKKKLGVKLCPEIIGKKNVFGSISEISRLVKETKCGFCIDFAHVLARYGRHDFASLKKNFPQKNWHCHFSGIEYGEKGEKRHKLTSEKDIKTLISNLPKDKNIVIINESPSPIEDSLLSIKMLKKR